MCFWVKDRLGFDQIFWLAISGQYWFGFRKCFGLKHIEQKNWGAKIILAFSCIYLEVCLDLKEEDLIATGQCCIKYQMSLGALIEAKKSGQSGGM